MAVSGELESLVLAESSVWSSIGVRCSAELHAGHQSWVFSATLGGDPLVVKLSGRRLGDKWFESGRSVSDDISDDAIETRTRAPTG